MITGKFPNLRLRRLRRYDWSRKMVQENNLSSNDLIYPLFITEGKKKKKPIKSMPNTYQYSIDNLSSVISKIIKNKIPMVALFPSTPMHKKNTYGDEALNENNLICKAIRNIKKNTRTPQKQKNLNKHTKHLNNRTSINTHAHIMPLKQIIT